jgi:enamine deaminase RidA (YjgF/YER057c/UK114 family)
VPLVTTEVHAGSESEEQTVEVEAKLEELGLVLPEPLKTPPGLALPFSWVRARGGRAYVSGHVPLDPDGSIAQPLGKVGAEVSEELRVFGMVNIAPGFDKQPNVINGFSDLILELYGPEAGDHARSAVGMAGLPVGVPVEIEAEVEIIGG